MIWLLASLAAIAGVALLALLFDPGAAPRATARVVSVQPEGWIDVEVDGRPDRVRLIGIETPPAVPAILKELVGGGAVRVERDAQERDEAGRLLAWLWSGDTLVNAELVRQGAARAAPERVNVRHHLRLLAAQREAWEARRGLWGPP